MFRLAAPGSVPVGCGGEVVLTVPLRVEVVGAPVDVPAEVVSTVDADVVTTLVTVVAGADVVAAEVSEEAAEEAEEVAPAEVETAPDGMTRVAPAAEQRPWAALRVASNSEALQLDWTQGTSPEMKAVAVQMHWKSLVSQPALPKLERAQERAHCGMFSSCRGKRAALAAATVARTKAAFILIDWLY